MPTAARIIGGLYFAALAWLVSDMIVPLMPEGTQFGWFHYVNAALGFLCGWKVLGPRVGYGYQAGLTSGLTTGIAMVLSALFIHSGVIMIDKSLGLRYDGPTEAVVDVFSLMFEHGLIMATPMIGATLLVGSFLGGWICEWVEQRWS